MSSGLGDVHWRTPSRWPWVLMYGRSVPWRINTTVNGKRIQVQLQFEDETKLDSKSQKKAASPNFIHALDASALVFALNALEYEGHVSSVATIHDSVGALAADMSDVRDAVRVGFVRLYGEHDPLRSFYDAIVSQIPEASRHLVPMPPKPGDFEINQVLASRYFFS